MIEIIPTVVPTSFEDVAATAARYPFARSLHVDFADGIFAPNTTWLPNSNVTPKVGDAMQLEAHLMVSDPGPIGVMLAQAGYSRIIGHIEAMGEQAPDILTQWKAAGAREAGVGILADTPVESLDACADRCDMVQMMTISKIGVQGLPFDDRAPGRVAELHKRYPDLLISVDGGVSEKNIESLARAGARRFCIGSALSKSSDPAAMYARLIGLARNAAEAA